MSTTASTTQPALDGLAVSETSPHFNQSIAASSEANTTAAADGKNSFAKLRQNLVSAGAPANTKNFADEDSDSTIGDNGASSAAVNENKKKKKKRNKNNKKKQGDAAQSQVVNEASGPKGESVFDNTQSTSREANGYRHSNTRNAGANEDEKDFTPLKEKIGQSFFEDQDSSEDEGMPDYKIGGYHPVHVGEILLDRYVII
jgi:hypothetical protein